MRVLHLSLSDFGGAGAAAFKLHQALIAADVDSCLLVLRSSRPKSDNVFVVPTINRWIYWVLSRIFDRWVKGSARGSPRARYFYSDFNHALLSPRSIERLGLRPDVIVVHSVAGFVSASLLRRMSAAWGAPVVWYLMDMGPLTGGCHFAFECDNYQRQCGCCPAIQSNRENDWSRKFWHMRRHTAKTVNGVVIAPNRWLERQARQSGIFRGMLLKCIELSIDLKIYCPNDRRAARRALGIPEDGQVIFFGAHFIDEERKGIRYLVDALQLLNQRLTSSELNNPTIVTAGMYSGSKRIKITVSQSSFRPFRCRNTTTACLSGGGLVRFTRSRRLRSYDGTRIIGMRYTCRSF